jgi:hypothetical protein
MPLPISSTLFEPIYRNMYCLYYFDSKNELNLLEAYKLYFYTKKGKNRLKLICHNTTDLFVTLEFVNKIKYLFLETHNSKGELIHKSFMKVSKPKFKCNLNWDSVDTSKSIIHFTIDESIDNVDPKSIIRDSKISDILEQ